MTASSLLASLPGRKGGWGALVRKGVRNEDVSVKWQAGAGPRTCPSADLHTRPPDSQAQRPLIGVELVQLVSFGAQVWKEHLHQTRAGCGFILPHKHGSKSKSPIKPYQPARARPGASMKASCAHIFLLSPAPGAAELGRTAPLQMLHQMWRGCATPAAWR